MNWTVWTAPAWIRHFPSTPPPRHTLPLRLEVARTEKTHFQVVMRSDTSTTVRLEAEGPAECRLRLRRVGYVSVEHHLDRSFFHLSDEPHGDEHLARYRETRALLAELAPWMKVMDALSDIRFARETLTDLPIPSIQVALDFLKEGIPCACYYCCGPRGRFLNRLLDTPLAKIAMHGFLFYRWPFRGFLHWGYNYWYESQTRRLINPFFIQNGLRWARGWAYGDPFLVYPGTEGPVDSIRWEIFAESLQDYRLLQTLDVSRDDPLFQPIRSFETFPKEAAWRRDQRARLFRKAARACS